MKPEPSKKSSKSARDTGESRRSPAAAAAKRAKRPPARKEIGGTDGPEPTRYGDWEHKGIASDF